VKLNFRALLISGYFGFLILIILLLGYLWKTYRKAPDQPIAFSHQRHVSFVGLECTHCHAYVEISAKPGIPAVAVCMECHENVATDRPEIIKLTKYWNDKQPVPWNDVHYLPPHVQFTHKRHIKKGFDSFLLANFADHWLHLLFKGLIHPDNALCASFCTDKFFTADIMLAVADEPRSLHSTANRSSQG